MQKPYKWIKHQELEQQEHERIIKECEVLLKVKNILNDELQTLKENMKFKLNTIKQSNDEKI